MCQLVTNYFPLLVRLWLDELFTINHKPFSLSIKLTNNHSLIRWYQVLSLSILTTLTILWRGYTPWSSIPWIAGSHLVRGFHPFPRKPGRFRPLDAKIKTSWTKESPSFWWDKNSHIPWNNDSSHEKHLGNEIPPFSNHSTSREIPEKNLESMEIRHFSHGFASVFALKNGQASPPSARSLWAAGHRWWPSPARWSCFNMCLGPKGHPWRSP